MDNVLDIKPEWVAVEGDQGERYQYPNTLTQHIKEVYSCVAVYRWAFYRSDGLRPYMVYVGEAEDLSRRMQDYLRGSKRTAKRIKAHLDEESSKGSVIHLDKFKFEDFWLIKDKALQTYELISVESLNNPFIRKMMENFGVLVHDATSCVILNKGGDRLERRRDKAIKLEKGLESMTPEARASFYARYGLKDS
jgi:hypothetical protein